MKLTFGRVITYIITTLFAFFVLVYVVDKIEDKKYRESCPHGMDFKSSFNLGIKDSSKVGGAKVYALDKRTGKVVDSTTISNSSGHYYFAKEVNTSYNWQIKLPRGQEIIVSDIKTELVEYWTSFGPTYRCEIKEWKVDGRQYNSEQHPFIAL